VQVKSLARRRDVGQQRCACRILIEAFLGGVKVSVAAHLGAVGTVRIDVHIGMIRE
jgi:hypothetical protein